MVMPTESNSRDEFSQDIGAARIGISINELQSPYYGAIADGALLYLKERGVNAIVHLTAHLRTGELEAWELVERSYRTSRCRWSFFTYAHVTTYKRFYANAEKLESGIA